MNKFAILVAFAATGCAGYRFASPGNPFGQYGIHSVAVPLFINRSSLPHVAAPLTKEIILLLSKYPSLKVYSGNRTDADAMLLGTIRSEGQRSEVFKVSEQTLTEGDLQESIGRRGKFVLPKALRYNLTLQLALIRRPLAAERQLLASKLAKYIRPHKRILFNTTMNLQGSFQQATRPTGTPDEPGIVNFTKSKKHFEDSVAALAKGAAATFEDSILDVF